MGKLKIYLGILALLITVLTPVNDSFAATNYIWKEWPSQINVPTDKVWKVKFNVPMDPKTAENEKYVYVFSMKKLSKHPVILDLSDDGKTLTITPKEDYILGDTYSLRIQQDVTTLSGQPLKNSIKMTFKTSRNFQIATMNGLNDFTSEESFDEYHDAKQAVSQDGSEVILENGKIVWMNSGIATTNTFTIIYEEQDIPHSDTLTYVNSGAELEYKDTVQYYDEKNNVHNAILVQIGDQFGYIKQENVALTPTSFVEFRSYYTNQDGDLVHYVYNGGHYEHYTYGPAPDSIEEGEKVYSWDGTTFEDVAYPFFNQLSLRTKTNYTADQLDKFIASERPNSPLIGLGKTFIEAQNKYNVNALYLMSHAIHESAWGMSEIARDKNNLYGLNATDNNPYGNADTFNSLEDCVMYAAQFVSTKYLNPGNFRYHGDYLGNKSGGMNVMYASDPYWGQKIAGYMYRADNYLGGLDSKLLPEQTTIEVNGGASGTESTTQMSN